LAISTRQFLCGRLTRLQLFVYLQARRFARHPDCSHPCISSTQGGRGFYVPAYLGLLPRRAGDMLTVRFGQLTVEGLSPSKIHSLAGCSHALSLLGTTRLLSRSECKNYINKQGKTSVCESIVIWLLKVQSVTNNSHYNQNLSNSRLGWVSNSTFRCKKTSIFATASILATNGVYWGADEFYVAKLLAVKRTVVTVSKWPDTAGQGSQHPTLYS